MRSEVFLDTSYAIALSAYNDDLHHRAVHLAEILETEGIRFGDDTGCNVRNWQCLI